ncbi:MAG: MBOAT family protein [Cyanobacteria bacterium]|nr:MBOAT family protein [Cyanobacteriota bacterium]MDA1021632.1 MBOAT family protein [Cyanobacteriota bacterium]
MSWKLEYVFLIAASTLLDYLCALQMAKKQTKPERKPYLIASVIGNLGMLFAFKYFNFFSSCFSGPVLNVILPVGISFYTFQTLSYSIDIYRGKMKPETHLGRFALYVSFFPQLVAGPIERASRLLPQFKLEHDWNAVRARDGLVLMLWGFFRKIVVADNIALFVNSVFENDQNFGGLSVLLAAYIFTFQVYLDFAAYSEIARGAAKVMGYDLMINFKRPYHATSLTDLWQRWHISLMTWLRDYIYVPITSSKDPMWKKSRNLILVFLLSGLWHGASWTFVVWGLLHGIFLVIENLTKVIRQRIYDCFFTQSSRIKFFIKNTITITILSVIGLFFRASNIEQGISMIAKVFDLTSYRLDFGLQNYKLLIFCMFVMALILITEAVEERLSWEVMFLQSSLVFRWTIYSLMIMACFAFVAIKSQPFVYFQF